MAVTITPTPASGSITATVDAVRFDIAGGDPNDEAGYDAGAYPTSPEFRYVLTMKVGGSELGRSQVFGVTPSGTFSFMNYIFPSAGTWTVQLYDVTDGINETAVTDAATIVVA